MKTDAQIEKDVLAELEFDSGTNPEGIQVAVKDRVVTLNGQVRSYTEKLAALNATKRLSGINGIADEIEVKLIESAHRTDTEIASAAAEAIRWITTLPVDCIRVIVRNGWLTLEGTVDTWRQKNAAEEALRNLVGVKGITNSIGIKSCPSVNDVKAAIRAAFEQRALLDANKIQVEVVDGKVVLGGNVNDCLEWSEAERAAWNAPGVTSVENRIITVI
jgi:osmotically-inducible protein OsmY